MFRQDDECWTLAWRGQVCRLREMHGLHYIARLLHDPGREFHVLDLVAADGGSVPRASPGNGVELLDARTKAAYCQRLRDLAAELEEAARVGDADGGARALAERDAIAERVAEAFGLGGRNHLAGAATQRARCTVAHGIRRVVKRVRPVLPPLAAELELRIKTGVYCVYVPDTVHPTRWLL
jgi:hypothetical protein